MRIIIVGANEATKTISNLLTSEKHKVTIVESNAEVAKKIESGVECTVICGDGTDLSILKDAGINEADAIVIGTNDDKTNLMVAEIAKETKVGQIIAVVNSAKNEELFTRLGIYKVVSFVNSLSVLVKQALSQELNQRIIAHLGEGKIQIIEVKIREKSPVIGKPISSLTHAIAVSIYRDGSYLMAAPKETFKEGDVVVVGVENTSIDKLLKEIG